MTDQIQEVFRFVDREVWIVTSAAGDKRGGLAATWVSQASIDDGAPTVVIGLGVNHYTRELIDSSGAFALHLLRSDQLEVAWNFAAGSGRERDKLQQLATRTEESQSPVLEDCLAWLDCRVFFRLDGGDRIYFFADVLSAKSVGSGKPLSESELISGVTTEQRAALAANRAQDVLAQRQLYREWRDRLEDGNR